MARPRKSGKREPNGKPQRPNERQRVERKEQDVMSVAISNPDRKPFGENARSQLAGTALGRLLMHRKIDRRQKTALERAGEIIRRHLSSIPQSVNGAPPSMWRMTKDDLNTEHAPQSEADMQISPEDMQIIARKRYDELQGILADGGWHIAGNSLLVKCHLMNRDALDHEAGTLRLIANHLARVWKLPVED